MRRSLPVMRDAITRVGLATVWLACGFLASAASAPQARADEPASQAAADPAAADSAAQRGRQLYQQQCASCHGERGEGVADKYDESLYGNRTLTELTRIINDTMPEEDPEACVGEDAERVARYIYETFYTAEARAKSNPPRVELVRLTVEQFRNSVADLLGTFSGSGKVDERRGLSATYYKSRNYRGSEKAFDRVDDLVDFDFGEGSPDEKIGNEEFSIRWEGSIIADESGEYQFAVRSENGFRLWVNDLDETLIDGWVSSGREPRDQSGTIHLLAGRAYPIRLDFFKFKDKTASIELRWRPPSKASTIVPRRHLTPARVPSTFVVSTPFPPDDASVGYERGTAVSPAWDLAATNAALETVGFVVEHVRQFTGVSIDGPERETRWKEFCGRFAERAFRRPLTDEQRAFFVDRQFELADAPETALKRSLLLVLKSPRFLYLDEFSGETVDDYDVAARLALTLWDSLPDQELLAVAAKGQLRSPGEVDRQARRMLDDPRAKAKLQGFFAHWLHFDEGSEIAKDAQAFPGFDAELVSDLRTSLELFVDDVVWSEGADFRRLLLASDLFVNQRLAEFYGVGDEQTEGITDFMKVSLDPAQRVGVVTHPYLLSALAYHKSSSPIHRGVFVTRRLLSRSLNPPPMAIEFMDGRFDPSLTMREKVAELTKPAACQTCHSIINPLGFSLENYDAVGRFRELENDRPVDASSVYTTSEGEAVPLTGARDLAEYAVADEGAQTGFVEQLFHHMVKQPAAAYGPDTLADLRQAFVAGDYNIRELIVDITNRSALQGVAEN